MFIIFINSEMSEAMYTDTVQHKLRVHNINLVTMTQLQFFCLDTHALLRFGEMFCDDNLNSEQLEPLCASPDHCSQVHRYLRVYVGIARFKANSPVSSPQDGRWPRLWKTL